MEETESRLTRFVIYALSARTIGQCSHFQSLSLGFVADIVPIDAREKSFSKVTLFDSTWRGEERRNQDRSVLILDDQENIVREHEFPSRLPYRVIIYTKQHERGLWKLELESKGDDLAETSTLDCTRSFWNTAANNRYVTIPSKLVKNSPFASRAIFPGYSVPCGEYRSDRCTSVEFLVAGGISRNDEALYAFAARFSASASTSRRS